MMAVRSVRKLDQELADCRENINTWFVMYSKLYNMKRSLSKKHLTQTDRAIELVAKSFTRHYYTDELVYSESDTSSDSDADTNDTDDVELLDDIKAPNNTKVLTSTKQSNKHTKQSGKTSNTTEFQDQAIKVLSEHEDEHAVLARHMDERRKEMRAAEQAHTSDVKFTQSVVNDEPHRPAQPVVESRADNLEECEVILEEEIIDEITGPNERILSDAEVAELATKCVAGMLGTQNDDPEKALVGTMPSSVMPSSADQLGVKFVTDTGEPPVVSALLKISPADRDKLYEKLYQTAKNNVLAQVDGKQVEPSRLNELIRKESDRLLQVYKETH